MRHCQSAFASYSAFLFGRECASLAFMIYGEFIMNVRLIMNADGEHFEWKLFSTPSRIQLRA